MLRGFDQISNNFVVPPKRDLEGRAFSDQILPDNLVTRAFANKRPEPNFMAPFPDARPYVFREVILIELHVTWV